MYLRRFLDEVPGNVYMEPGGNPKAAGGPYEERAALFVELARGDPGLAHDSPRFRRIFARVPIGRE